MSDALHQLKMVFGGSSVAVARPTTKAENKRFLPVAGVPKTRADCPSTTHESCPHVRCRYHLFRVDACDRAGRPSLANVPRDEHGRTLPVQGDMGSQRAGTTLTPAWLRLERTCLMRVIFDGTGGIDEFEPLDRKREPLHRWLAWEESHIGSWDLMRRWVKPDQALYVFGYMSNELLALAYVTDGGIRVKRLVDYFESVVVFANIDHQAPSCALDLAERGGMSNEEVGAAMGGKHRTLIARDVKRAGGKLRKAGVDLRDLVDGK